MSQLKVDSIIPRGGLPSGASGGIIQIVQTVKTDTFSANTGSSFVDITGMTVTITPQSASNRTRSTAFQGNPPSSVNSYHYCVPFLDSPNTTSATTYKLQARGEGSNTDIFVNRGESDTDAGDRFRGASSMTAMEVGM